MALSSYSTGTASVSAGGTTVTGTGTIWSGVNARPGDIFQIGNFQTIITEVVDTDMLTIPPWGGGNQSGATYTIWQWFPQRVAGAEVSAAVNQLVAALETDGFFVFVDSALTEPDPSLGNEGQYAFQPTTGKTWAKVSGVWTYLGIYKAFQLRGAWDSGTDYAVNDVVTLNGSSYICVSGHTNHTPPNTTYWQVLAAKGDPGDAATVAVGSVTTVAYGAPATVTNSGTSDAAILDFEIPAGEPGTGDLIAANNLSDLASAEASRKNLGIPTVLPGYLSGLTLSTAGSSTTFAVAAGVAVDDSNTDFMRLSASISKTTSAWAVGTGNGSLDTGTIANSTWYHVFEIKRPDTGAVDILISTSVSAPTMPASYTLKRRIGSMKTNGSSQWIKFTQLGDEFLWDVPVHGDVNLTSYTNGTAIALTVPPGVKVFAKFTGVTSSAAGNNEVAFSSRDVTLSSADSGGSIQGAGVSTYQSFGLMRIRTDTSRQIQAWSSNALVYMRLTTYGWEDLRGKV